MTKYLNKNLILALAVVAITVAGAFFYAGQGNEETLSPQEAAEKAMAFINQSIQDQGVTASLLDVIDEGAIYRISLEIKGTEYGSFITKDGKFLFSSGFNLEEQPEEVSQEEPASLEDFAQCLTDSGVKFYGAFWCDACNQQKELFGEASQYLPYVECSNENREMTSECQEAGITSYPTWEFNGEKSSGVKSIEQLAELSGCPLE